MLTLIELIIIFIAMIFILLLPIAWFIHVIFCIATGSWLLLIAGAIFFPIGVVHWFIIWF
jgi:hypothetical protein